MQWILLITFPFSPVIASDHRERGNLGGGAPPEITEIVQLCNPRIKAQIAFSWGLGASPPDTILGRVGGKKMG